MATEDVQEPQAEAVAGPAGDEGADGAQKGPYVLPEYDEALLIKVKGKVKAPVKPDDTEKNLQLGKLKDEINRRAERIKEIKVMEEQRRASRGGPSPAVAEINGRMTSLRSEFQEMLRQKQHIRNELSECIKQRDALRGEQRALRDDLTNSRIPGLRQFDQVEARAQEIEAKLDRESPTATELKKMQDQLAQLTSLRRGAIRHNQVSQQLEQIDVQKAQISKRLTECDGVLNALSAKQDAERAAKEEIMGKTQSDTVDWQALAVEKQECWQIQQALRTKMDEIYKEYNERYQQYIKQDRAYRAWQKHDKHAKYLERQKFREEREAERADQDVVAAGGESSAAEPYESEILTIDQLLTYLRKFTATDDSAVKEEKKEVEVPQGMRAFKRKDEEDLASAFVVKKKPAKGAQPKQEKAAPVDTKKKLNHALDTLSTFMTLKIDVPLTTAEIPATIEKVEAKRQHYLELRKRKKAGLPVPKAESNGHAAEEKAGPSGSKADDEPAAKASPAKASPAKQDDASPVRAAGKSSGGDSAVGVTLSVDNGNKVSMKLRVSEDS